MSLGEGHGGTQYRCHSTILVLLNREESISYENEEASWIKPFVVVVSLSLFPPTCPGVSEFGWRISGSLGWIQKAYGAEPDSYEPGSLLLILLKHSGSLRPHREGECLSYLLISLRASNESSSPVPGLLDDPEEFLLNGRGISLPGISSAATLGIHKCSV